MGPILDRYLCFSIATLPQVARPSLLEWCPYDGSCCICFNEREHFRLENERAKSLVDNGEKR